MGERAVRTTTEHAGVRRTKARVIAVARELLPKTGAAGLTYSLLAERAKVTRQTLYRHWPNQEHLLAELVLTGPDVGYPSKNGDLRATVIEFLTSLRAGLAVPTTAATITALTAQADRDPTSDHALATVAEDRRRALNALIEPAGQALSEDDFALLCGPILYRRFIARTPITNGFITTIVDTWLAHQNPQESPPAPTRGDSVGDAHARPSS